MSTTTKRPVYWISEIPTHCEVTNRPITDRFVDGTVGGSWACWHPDAFEALGGMYGQGRGQLYERQPTGQWLKIEG